MLNRTTLMVFMVAVCLAVVPAAMAYDETGMSADPSNCAGCHASGLASADATGFGRQGPHGGYSSTGSACGTCHMAHGAAADGYVLLPRATLTETCELCHDGTGGLGVYGAIAMRGLKVQSAHRIDTTSAVPGGDESTGGTSTVMFGGPDHTLNCADCHSPHGSKLVEPFTSDRLRNATDTAGNVSSELLRRRPTGAATETAVYGAKWCAGCHAGRLSAHDVSGHPVDATETGAFDYEHVDRVTGVGSVSTELGTLGASNFGYVMPYPRTAGQDGHFPICQQCHEDARSVGDVSAGTIAGSEVFSVTSADGGGENDNPRFQVFPHESSNPDLLIETADDLCINCHLASQLR